MAGHDFAYEIYFEGTDWHFDTAGLVEVGFGGRVQPTFGRGKAKSFQVWLFDVVVLVLRGHFEPVN